MSRRFWLGTPKGQNTSAVTIFATSRLTNTSFNTSANTLSPTTFITQWYTPTPTSNITTTSYNTLFTDPGFDTEYSSSFVTNYITNFSFTVSTGFAVTTTYSPTSHQTFKGNYNTSIVTTLTPGTTSYIVPGGTSYTPTSTDYPVLTPTNTVVTSYTPTSTDYPVLTPTNTTITSYTPTSTEYPYSYQYATLYGQPTSHITPVTTFPNSYQSTAYSQNTTVTGYYYTTYSTSTTPYTYPSSASGCYLYNADGSSAGQTGGVPAGCTIVSCTPAGQTYSSGQVLTAYSYSQSTFYTSTYISNVTTYSTTSSNTYVGQGLTSPPFAGGCYPEIDAAEYCANAESNCYPCNIYELTSVINTSIQGYSVTATVYYNSGYILNQYTTVSYLSEDCFDCSLTCEGVNTTITPNPQGGYIPPSSRVTNYSVVTDMGPGPAVVTPTPTSYVSSYYLNTTGTGTTPVNTLYTSFGNRLTNYTTYTAINTQVTGFGNRTTNYTTYTAMNTPYTSVSAPSPVTSPTTYTSFATTISSALENTTYPTDTALTTSFRDTDYATSNPTSRTTTTTYLQNTGATAYEVPTSHSTTTTYDTDSLTQQSTTRDTEVITSWLTDDDVTTSFTTSRSTTWFTQ
jgi:hypothetical protein